MKKVFNYKITDKVAKTLEAEYDVNLDTITEEDFEDYLKDFCVDFDEEFAWVDEDLYCICYLKGNGFFEIKELGIYVAEDSNSQFIIMMK